MALRARGRLVTLAAVVMTAASASSASASSASAHAAAAPPWTPGGIGSATLSAAGLDRLADKPWFSHTYLTSAGQSVRVSVSPAYSGDPGAGQRWAAFFESLVHGDELGFLQAYIAPLDEVTEICGDGALGCYGSDHLVAMGEANFGIAAESVVAHEYGHHVASHRTNAPWLAVDWGTKRWASDAGICRRAIAGTAFPGDEGMHYMLNPGEAFAEAFRVLVETGGSAEGFSWDLVDPTFRPDAEALDRVRADVLDPWIAPKAVAIHGKFLRRSRTWTKQVSTPFDGDLRLRLTVPGGGTDDVTLLSADRRTVLAKGSWTSSGGKSLEYRVCGERSVGVRITRGGSQPRFSLLVTTP